MVRKDPKFERATAEVIAIVRELLDVEERKQELERQLEQYIRVDGAVEIERPKLTALQSPPPYEVPLTDVPPNRMTPQGSSNLCPFGCGYEAISDDDMADHIAGCQPNDAR